MKVAIIGTGYVGLPTGVGLATLGHEVVCIDREISKIEKLKQARITLYEDGLEDLLKENIQKGRIKFTTSMQEGVVNASVVIIAVGTPPHPVTHEADLKYVYAAASELAPFLEQYTVIANKSTVPVGTGDSVESLIYKTNPHAQCDVVSLPEFLREGFAVYDFFHPDRIVVGVNNARAKAIIDELYAPLLAQHSTTHMLYVSRRSSETIKYASNSFLATKIHFINEMADFCEQTGANIYEVAQGMGLDKRIGSSFLNPGPAFGGSCFPKDTLAMDFMARQNEVNLSLIKATIEGNNKRIIAMGERILAKLKLVGDSPCLAVLGLAFKNGTDDCRASPAMQILHYVMHHNLNVQCKVYDPKALFNAQELLAMFNERIIYCSNALETTVDADVLSILTEWEEFRSLDLHIVKAHMRHHYIVDCRNMLNKSQALEFGFNYQGIGV